MTELCLQCLQAIGRAYFYSFILKFSKQLIIPDSTALRRTWRGLLAKRAANGRAALVQEGDFGAYWHICADSECSKLLQTRLPGSGRSYGDVGVVDGRELFATTSQTQPRVSVGVCNSSDCTTAAADAPARALQFGPEVGAASVFGDIPLVASIEDLPFLVVRVEREGGFGRVSRRRRSRHRLAARVVRRRHLRLVPSAPHSVL